MPIETLLFNGLVNNTVVVINMKKPSIMNVISLLLHAMACAMLFVAATCEAIPSGMRRLSIGDALWSLIQRRNASFTTGVIAAACAALALTLLLRTVNSLTRRAAIILAFSLAVLFQAACIALGPHDPPGVQLIAPYFAVLTLPELALGRAPEFVWSDAGAHVLTACSLWMFAWCAVAIGKGLKRSDDNKQVHVTR